MSLPNLSRSQLRKSLKEVGLSRGDGLLIHSALQFFGRPEGGEGMYLEVLEEILGPEGTIVVPTFTFAFARGEDYEPNNSASEAMGLFSEMIRQDPRALRTKHPMQSFAMIGQKSQELTSLDTASAFDDGSAIDYMLQMNFKLLLLGADIQSASIVHYSEQRASVPYRYWKDFTSRIWIENDWKKRSYRMFVRDLEIDPQLILAPIRERLIDMQAWTSSKVNFGEIAQCSLKDFVRATDGLLEADPWVLIGNRETLKI